MVCNDIKLDVAIGAKLDGMELLKGQTKKLRMLEMIQGGSQEHDPEQAEKKTRVYKRWSRRCTWKCNQRRADGLIERCQQSMKWMEGKEKKTREKKAQ